MNLNTVKYKNKICRTNQKNDIQEPDKAKDAQVSSYQYRKALNVRTVAVFMSPTEFAKIVVFTKDSSTLNKKTNLKQRSYKFR